MATRSFFASCFGRLLILLTAKSTASTANGTQVIGLVVVATPDEDRANWRQPAVGEPGVSVASKACRPWVEPFGRGLKEQLGRTAGSFVTTGLGPTAS